MNLRRAASHRVPGTGGVAGDDAAAHMMESLGLEIDRRKDIVLAQCMSALVSTFLTAALANAPTRDNRAAAENWWAAQARVGFLCQFEAVNNGSSRDHGALEDCVVGVRALERVYMRIVDYPRSAGTISPTVSVRAVNSASASAPAGTAGAQLGAANACLLYTSPSPRDGLLSRMPSSA